MAVLLKDALAQCLLASMAESGLVCSPSEIEASFEVPKEEKFGDLSTNLVLKEAKQAKKAPRPLAEAVADKMRHSLSQPALHGRIEKIGVEGPGFINFYFSATEHARVLLDLRSQGSRFGAPASASRRILLEYVSANPTGPLTVAHGRQAALGDSLTRILRFCGHHVTTEYYNNDEGVQIQTLGQSMLFRVNEILKGPQGEIPENYYRGEYLIQIAKEFVDRHGREKLLSTAPDELLKTCRIQARDVIMKSIVQDLSEFDVAFDNYYSQEALGASGKVEETLTELSRRGVTKEEEGALWLCSTRWGDDKDRVLIKSDKNYTYLTPDIAYHHEKFGRGFEELINIWGPDHHGYIARLKASQAALGHPAEKIHILIAQLVTLYEGERQVRMSTRAGEFITLRQILDEVGKDAGRFFFVMRKFDAHLDFDLALAKSQTPENPVFYIQYAHARIESIKNSAKDKGVSPRYDEAMLCRLSTEHEIRLLRLLAQFEDHIRGAEKTLEPYRLVPYLMELAACFHRFYTENRVVTEDEDLTLARYWLIEGVQQVIRTGLQLLGVSAPLKM